MPASGSSEGYDQLPDESRGQMALANRLETQRFTNLKAEDELKWPPADDSINCAERDVPWLTEHKEELSNKWNALYAQVNK